MICFAGPLLLTHVHTGENRVWAAAAAGRLRGSASQAGEGSVFALFVQVPEEEQIQLGFTLLHFTVWRGTENRSARALS